MAPIDEPAIALAAENQNLADESAELFAAGCPASLPPL